MTIREATQEWLKEFNEIPNQVIIEMAKSDEQISCYDSDNFRLISSPAIQCGYCSANYDGDKSLKELQEENNVKCEYCEDNTGDLWEIGYPEYAFPTGWGTLFSPKSSFDSEWMAKNADQISKLGIFVFDSDIYGIILGIDAGGFDFYDAYWIPLYKLRGLKWHDSN